MHNRPAQAQVAFTDPPNLPKRLQRTGGGDEFSISGHGQQLVEIFEHIVFRIALRRFAQQLHSDRAYMVIALARHPLSPVPHLISPIHRVPRHCEQFPKRRVACFSIF